MSRTTLLIGLLVLILIPVEAAAQDVSAEAVDALFAEMDKPDTPGCALAVIHKGEIVYKNGYGMASLEHRVPITPQTVFYSGSVSKQFVALSIALLAEQGKLSFDDDIRTYLPELPEYDRTITIRHMIHHTSGLRDYLQLGFLAGRNYLDAMAEEEVLALIARQKELNFSPGDQYLYSNSGYFLLAEIVKRASGQTLRQFADTHILGPLGMANSHFHDDNTMVVPNRADGYFKQDDGWGVLTMRFALVGSGGLYTTVEDLYRWDQNFYHNRLGAGTQDLIETALTRGVLTSGHTLGYAFAVNIGAYRGLKTVGHSGSLGGFRAHLQRFPEQQFTTALLCNFTTANPGNLANQLADHYLAAVLAPGEVNASSESASRPEQRPVGLVAPAHFKDLAGTYYSDELQVAYTIAFDEGSLALRIQDQPPGELSMVGKDQGRAWVGSLAFERDADGTVTGFVLQSGRVRNMRFARK